MKKLLAAIVVSIAVFYSVLVKADIPIFGMDAANQAAHDQIYGEGMYGQAIAERERDRIRAEEWQAQMWRERVAEEERQKALALEKKKAEEQMRADSEKVAHKKAHMHPKKSVGNNQSK